MSPCVYHHLIIIIFLIKIIIKIFILSDNLTQESTYLGPLREYHFHLYHLHLITVISAIWSVSSSSPKSSSSVATSNCSPLIPGPRGISCATHASQLCTGIQCNASQLCTGIHWPILQCRMPHSSAMQYINTLHYTVMHCNALQCKAVQCTEILHSYFPAPLPLHCNNCTAF